MQVIPVLDLMQGQVVRGVAGQREQYLPNHSVLTDSTDPLVTALAIRSHFGLNRFYIADLDAITGQGQHLRELLTLRSAGFELLLDAGLKTQTDAAQWLLADADLVVGLETLTDWNELRAICDSVPVERLYFSLDLKQGKPMGVMGADESALPIFMRACQIGVQNFIVLDLAAVGVNQGTPTLDLCRQLREAAPHVNLITGGGIRHAQDIASAAEAGINGLLIASALHDGRIQPHELTEDRP